jgi:hypothetical protein
MTTPVRTNPDPTARALAARPRGPAAGDAHRPSLLRSDAGESPENRRSPAVGRPSTRTGMRRRPSARRKAGGVGESSHRPRRRLAPPPNAAAYPSIVLPGDRENRFFRRRSGREASRSARVCRRRWIFRIGESPPRSLSWADRPRINRESRAGIRAGRRSR